MVDVRRVVRVRLCVVQAGEGPGGGVTWWQWRPGSRHDDAPDYTAVQDRGDHFTVTVVIQPSQYRVLVTDE